MDGVAAGSAAHLGGAGVDVTGLRAEGKGQRAEGRGQKAEGKGQRAEGVMNMKTDLRGEFIKLVSTVVGLSVGVGVMTATVLLGAAALLQ